MKMIRILFMFALVLAVGSAYGQVKVVTSGNTNVGSTDDPGIVNLKSTGSGEIEFAVDALSGNTDFTYQVAGASKGQIKYINANPGITYNLDANNGGSGGVPDTRSALYLSASDLQVGVNTQNPNATLDVNGDLNYSGMISNNSDRRLKTNVNEFELGLNAILNLQPKTYNYNGKAGLKTDKEQVGIMAQDLQVVAPSLVHSWEYVEYANQTQEEVDAELPLKVVETTEYLKVNEGAIKYMLINAIKEQQKLINELTERVNQLERK